VKYIHVTCLKEWIKEKRSVKCELCGQNYSKKWAKWAQDNRIISAGKKGASCEEKTQNILKGINIAYTIIVFVMGITQIS
jgi:hypothetical protein